MRRQLEDEALAAEEIIDDPKSSKRPHTSMFQDDQIDQPSSKRYKMLPILEENSKDPVLSQGTSCPLKIHKEVNVLPEVSEDVCYGLFSNINEVDYLADITR